MLTNDARLRNYLGYRVGNYIDEDYKFPPKIWACAEASSYRTTNCCESFHSDITKSFYAPHSDIFKFGKILNILKLTVNSFTS
nr:unnamed protein product [Callosobruchus analis]